MVISATVTLNCVSVQPVPLFIAHKNLISKLNIKPMRHYSYHTHQKEEIKKIDKKEARTRAGKNKSTSLYLQPVLGLSLTFHSP